MSLTTFETTLQENPWDKDQSLCNMESLRNSHQSLKNSRQSLKNSRQSLENSRQSLNDSRQSLGDGRQSLHDSHQNLQASCQNLGEGFHGSRQYSPDSSEPPGESNHQDSKPSLNDSPSDQSPQRSPKVEGLNDFKELCKSVASLLHIEDHAAAAMLTEPLSGRRDLVEGLDADAILDYLKQHGVLDSDTLQSLRNTTPVTQRNTALLQRVEGEGATGVALFINALRQSGQLHLASSLDNTQRIKPVSGNYWEKQRHKGQVTVQMVLAALYLTVSERDNHGDVVDTTLMSSPSKQMRRGHHQSYENMLEMENEGEAASRAISITQYPYEKHVEEEKEVVKSSFFCFCFPRKKKGLDKAKKYEQHKQPQEISKVKKAYRFSDTLQESKSVKGKSHQGGDAGDINFPEDSQHKSAHRDSLDDLVSQKNGVNERHSLEGAVTKKITNPVIMEYNKQMELVKLKAFRDGDHADPSKPIMCDKWKWDGHQFRKKLAEFCQQFEFDLQTYIIKYFEQDRGTLVLQTWTDGSAMYVTNICLTAEQLKQLQQDYNSGALHERLDSILRRNGSLGKVGILDAKLEVSIRQDDFEQALCELT